jgi:hypothetical protein
MSFPFQIPQRPKPVFDPNRVGVHFTFVASAHTLLGPFILMVRLVDSSLGSVL